MRVQLNKELVQEKQKICYTVVDYSSYISTEIKIIYMYNIVMIQLYENNTDQYQI